MSKNSNGEGSIYRRTRAGKPAGYAGQLTYTDADGVNRRHTAYGPTRLAVRKELDTVRDRVNAGRPAKDAETTVAVWLTHWRSTVLAAADVKPATRNLYSRLSRVHLEPAPFGGIRLDRLKPSDIDALKVRLIGRTKPSKVEGAPPVRALADATVRLIYVTLRSALDAAVRDGLIARNPAVAVDRPHVAKTEARYLGTAQVAALLHEAQESRHYVALVLIAATGLRRGEALGLTWERIDFDAGTVKVAATLDYRRVLAEPKTTRSRRTLPIPPAVVALLKRHKTAQAAERLRAANQWQNGAGLVFTTELGGPVDGRSLLHVVKAAANRAGVGGAVVHSLRHSAAVGWLEGGTHIRGVADLLGHSSVATTGDIYAHTTQDVARDAVYGWVNGLGL